MRQSPCILQLSGVEIDQALECNPCLEQVEEYPENTLIDYSNSSRTVESKEPTDISRTYNIELSWGTDSDLNHVTGVGWNSSYDTVKQDTTLQDELLHNLSNQPCRGQLTTNIC